MISSTYWSGEPADVELGSACLAPVCGDRLVARKRHAKSRHAIMKRSGAVAIACGLGIGSLALNVASLEPPAYGQSADLVLCDRLAADPADPDKPKDVKGTAEIAPSDLATAIKFCKVASAASRRALYQLGRAYAANQQLTEAVSAYRKAADKGSTSAMVELGVLLATGSGVAKTKLRHASCSSAPPQEAIPAARPISRPSTRVAAPRRIPLRREPRLPKRRRRIRPRRNIGSE